MRGIERWITANNCQFGLAGRGAELARQTFDGWERAYDHHRRDDIRTKDDVLTGIAVAVDRERGRIDCLARVGDGSVLLVHRIDRDASGLEMAMAEQYPIAWLGSVHEECETFWRHADQYFDADPAMFKTYVLILRNVEGKQLSVLTVKAASDDHAKEMAMEALDDLTIDLCGTDGFGKNYTLGKVARDRVNGDYPRHDLYEFYPHR